MITLQELMKLYEPEFENETIEIKLYTFVKVGDITQKAILGTFPLKDGNIKNLDMNKMIVEKFTIPNQTKTKDTVTCIEIIVSDNINTNVRNEKGTATGGTVLINHYQK